MHDIHVCGSELAYAKCPFTPRNTKMSFIKTGCACLNFSLPNIIIANYVMLHVFPLHQWALSSHTHNNYNSLETFINVGEIWPDTETKVPKQCSFSIKENRIDKGEDKICSIAIIYLTLTIRLLLQCVFLCVHRLKPKDHVIEEEGRDKRKRPMRNWEWRQKACELEGFIRQDKVSWC